MMINNLKRKVIRLPCLEQSKLKKVTNRKNITLKMDRSKVKVGFLPKKKELRNKENKLLQIPNIREEKGLQNFDYSHFYIYIFNFN